MLFRSVPDVLPAKAGQGSENSGKEGRETLSRALPRGRDSPWIPVFWGYGGRISVPASLGIPRRADRPPTHFFVKKKFIPIGDTETTTQKVPSVFCYARDFLCRVKHCATLGGFIPSL